MLDIIASEARPWTRKTCWRPTPWPTSWPSRSRTPVSTIRRRTGGKPERQRLARDLHDAVSQTLFSVSLIAEVLPRIYARDPAQGAQRLEELRQLTRGALAEMRTLLLELRPAALAEANLPDLLKQLGEAVTGRARIPVEVASEDTGALPADVRLAFYRIAQEALNNVAKHSGAAKAKLSLAPLPGQPGGARLTVEDDGAGFDPAGAGGGQLGLGIMRERAEAVEGRLLICSAPERGRPWPSPGRLRAAAGPTA